MLAMSGPEFSEALICGIPLGFAGMAGCALESESLMSWPQLGHLQLYSPGVLASGMFGVCVGSGIWVPSGFLNQWLRFSV